MNKKGSGELILILIMVLLFILIFMLFVLPDIARDNACNSIGYDGFVKSGSEHYCVKNGDTQKIAFKNCFFTCDIYKLE